MHLTFGEKATLDSLVNFFGGKSLLIRAWEKDPHHRRMVAKGLTRWGRISGGMREHIATKKGVALAKRFKKDWSELWSERHPTVIEE